MPSIKRDGQSAIAQRLQLPRQACYPHSAPYVSNQLSINLLLLTISQFPLDSIKTRMQTYHYRNFVDCITQTYQTERIRGFFRGVTAPLASVTVVRTISFSIYQRSKYTYAAWLKRNFGLDPLVHVNTVGTYPTLSTIACFGAAGATAGSFITVIACMIHPT